MYRNLTPYGAVANRAEKIREEEPQELSEEEGREQATAFFSRIMSTGR